MGTAPGGDDIEYRPAQVADLPFLATMLGEAAVWRPDKPTPTAEQVMADPRYAMYLAGWPRHGDYGLGLPNRTDLWARLGIGRTRR